MQNAEANPSQSQQNEMAAKSPAKTPAAGSASPDAATQAKEFGSSKHATSAEGSTARKTSPLPPIEVDPYASDSGDPVVRANSRIVSVDNAGMAASDDTVDTDGKTLEARKDESPWHDNVITSNATLENNVPVPAVGLGGLDSRPGGHHPLIQPRNGYRVVFGGTTYEEQLNGSRAEHIFRFEPVNG
ncbi:DUF3005 domain-containing protein [Paraburkholderia sp.]|jgi:hypothetical protein|uniref:DUF3005 domain-containing protein n=1 Tax=Paraburkholderia sp. TaxID=1926495 RepID=UPI002F421C15